MKEIEWKCGKCGKEYTFDEWRKLNSYQLVPEDTNPKEQHGYTKICFCGYVFHRDKWHKVTKINLRDCFPKFKIRVSTVFLELNHSGKWYETMIFPEEGNIRCNSQWRYVTKEEALKNHKKIVEDLRDGKFSIKPVEYELDVIEGNIKGIKGAGMSYSSLYFGELLSRMMNIPKGNMCFSVDDMIKKLKKAKKHETFIFIECG